MPTTATLAEETVHRLAPDNKALQAARELVRKKNFLKPGVSADGTWLLAECKGSGASAYEVSVDLFVESAPVGRCTCPSRKFPCKHALGLMLAYAQAPEAFGKREPPAELVAKRERQAERAKKKTDAPGAPRKVNQAALAKKVVAQREGLDLLKKIVLDLVAGGQWFEGSRLRRLERQTKQMSDSYLPGAHRMLRQLLELAEQDRSDEERDEIAANYFAELWATVQRGRNYLDGKLAGDETQMEADAVIEEVLGHAWQLTELREKGYFREDLHLLELAYDRQDDEARQARVETSYLLDLQEGAVLRAVTYRPFKGMERIPGQPSYTQPLRVREAALYPGFVNRRVRWEKGAEQTEPLGPAHFQRAYALAAPTFEAAVAAYRQQIKDPLWGDDRNFVLLRCQRIGRVGDQVVLEDAKGNRLVAAEYCEGESNITNLVRAAGMLQQPAVLIRFFLNACPTRIFVQPLAVLTDKAHLRLGI